MSTNACKELKKSATIKMTEVGKIYLQGLLNREPPHRQNRHIDNQRGKDQCHTIDAQKNYRRIIGEKAISEATVENRDEKKKLLFFLQDEKKKNYFQKKLGDES